MAHFTFNDPVNNTSASTFYPNGGVYTEGIAAPTAPLDLDGNRPILISNVAAAHAVGASGINPHIIYQGVGTPGPYRFGSSGGSFTFKIAYVSGTLSFGRNTGFGTVVDVGGGSWAGSLVGSFDWASVPSSPASITPTRSGRSVTVVLTASSGGDGASPITAYAVQYSKDGGAWTGAADHSGSVTYTNLTPGSTYRFRGYAGNAVGSSLAIESGNVFIPAGGKRFDGTNWVNTSIAKRLDASGNWVDLSIAKRLTASGWVDLS